MHLHVSLVLLPCVIYWSDAYIGLGSALLSSHRIDPYATSAQPLVTLTDPSYDSFPTENITKSKFSVSTEKNQDPGTEKTEPADAKTNDTSTCPEQEDLDCDECGGQKYDEKEGTFRCVGAEEDLFKWKDCFCMGKQTKKSIPYEPQSPTPEEIQEEFDNLPDWKNSTVFCHLIVGGPEAEITLVGKACSGEEKAALGGCSP
ncbi:hypothetical protein IFR05_009393 [Cadophora sp. M221]|nr:hypothetical protein IFR05_009393 [Cadophora sp. M221]